MKLYHAILESRGYVLDIYASSLIEAEKQVKVMVTANEKFSVWEAK